jgi:hypothetical protein
MLFAANGRPRSAPETFVMKTNWIGAAIVIVAASAIAACGRSPDQKAAEDLKESSATIQKSTGDMQKGAEEMARGFEAMARGLAGAAGGEPGVTPVEPVNFHELQNLMPDVSGWEKTNPTGERMTTPFSFSQASVTYRKGDAEIEQKILDSGLNQVLFAPFAMFMASGYEKETQDGFERSVDVGGNPGWEKWDKGTRNGDLNVIVNRRFLVQVEGRSVDDIRTLHTVLDRTDLKKLAALK